MPRGLCTKNFFRQNPQSKVQKQQPEVWEKGNWLLHHDNALSSPCSPGHFWPKITWLLSQTQPRHLIWYPVTSLYFPNWNSIWKAISLRRLRWSKKKNCIYEHPQILQGWQQSLVGGGGGEGCIAPLQKTVLVLSCAASGGGPWTLLPMSRQAYQCPCSYVQFTVILSIKSIMIVEE